MQQSLLKASKVRERYIAKVLDGGIYRNIRVYVYLQTLVYIYYAFTLICTEMHIYRQQRIDIDKTQYR